MEVMLLSVDSAVVGLADVEVEELESEGAGEDEKEAEAGDDGKAGVAEVVLVAEVVDEELGDGFGGAEGVDDHLAVAQNAGAEALDDVGGGADVGNPGEVRWHLVHRDTKAAEDVPEKVERTRENLRHEAVGGEEDEELAEEGEGGAGGEEHEHKVEKLLGVRFELQHEVDYGHEEDADLDEQEGELDERRGGGVRQDAVHADCAFSVKDGAAGADDGDGGHEARHTAEQTRAVSEADNVENSGDVQLVGRSDFPLSVVNRAVEKRLHNGHH
mmetsp:Transcript_36087/g.64542  ORF Transcript_36087/g.64542 Transcript_36087/m.64542 type:complete len:272 (-) Transcript_36087:281-1096(-)